MSSLSSESQDAIIHEGDYYSNVNGYTIPQNINHRFRTKITAELLADADKVERDKNDFQYVNIREKTPVYHRPRTSLPSANPDYTKISNDLRYTVARGHPVQRQSHSKTTHNKEIFENRETGECSDLHRRKKDWLARWTEANIIRSQLYKNILESQKKAT